LFGSYRKGQADDPEIYVAAITAVLSEYPPDVVAYVTDPRTGLQQRSKWLPDVPEVREACEDAMAPRYRAQREAQARAEREAEATRQARIAAEPKPTLAEMEAKIGRPIQPRPLVEIGPEPHDGKHAKRVVADLAKRRASSL
jgi:hypothetical protein